MNFFIDFDHTLYNTPLLTEDMLKALALYMSQTLAKDLDDIYKMLKNKFKRGTNNIYDIYKLIEYYAIQYNYNKSEATQIINTVIANGKQYLFSDSIPFLKALKAQNHKVYILSYNENEVYFQAVKIAGSGLLTFVDGIFPTTSIKGDIPLDFSKCIFIDDKPKDLISIYKNKPLKIFRIRRKNDTYSEIETNLPIPEVKSLDELLSNLWNKYTYQFMEE